jgi:chemotaxis protein MotB
VSEIADDGDASDSPGLPGWVMTFADLMTLLMCFFVLLLSFSELDVARFKQLAGSMQQAFGVQAEVEVKTMPKGTSMIAREFSPGRPQPTVLDTVRQFTVNSNMNSLDVGSQRLTELIERERQAEAYAEHLRRELREEIANGKLLVRVEEGEVVVQILEKDSFASGRADLEASFLPTLLKIGGLMKEMSGAITVSGHTDDVPIYNGSYRSNWDLSSARAASVVHEILKTGIEPARLMVSGHADTQPRAANDTPAHRALNRRIDIALATNKPRHGTWHDATAEPTASADGDIEGTASPTRAEPADGSAASAPTPTVDDVLPPLSSEPVADALGR